MKTTPPPLHIAQPCPKSWDAMPGDAKRRFCEQCQHHVHNVSAMSPREREAFVEKTGGNACISYLVRPDGSLVFTTWRTRLAAPFRRLGYMLTALLATILPFAFSACGSRAHTLGKMLPPEKRSTAGERENIRLTGTPLAPKSPPAKPQGPVVKLGKMKTSEKPGK